MRTQSFLTFLLLFAVNSAAQELIGPEKIPLGTLASFEVVPAQEASWYIVTPSLDSGNYQVDTGQSMIYFASPLQGRYTVIAGIVIDGKPALLVKTFDNGEDDRTLPIPIPPVSSLEMWIKTELTMFVESENFNSEILLVAECFEQIVQRINTENIRTVQNAQAQLQIALTGTLALASPTAVTEWTPFLSALSQRLETELGDKIDDLDEVKQMLQKISDVMKSFERPHSTSTHELRIVLPNIDNPTNRGQGTQNRVFRPLLTR